MSITEVSLRVVGVDGRVEACFSGELLFGKADLLLLTKVDCTSHTQP